MSRAYAALAALETTLAVRKLGAARELTGRFFFAPAHSLAVPPAQTRSA